MNGRESFAKQGALPLNILYMLGSFSRVLSFQSYSLATSDQGIEEHVLLSILLSEELWLFVVYCGPI